MEDMKSNPEQYLTTRDNGATPSDPLYLHPKCHLEIARRPVTQDALVRRIRRWFARRSEQFHVGRTTYSELGNYWATSENGALTCWGILDLESWARDGGFLAADECLSP